MDDLQNHINGVQTLTADELNQVKNLIHIYADRLPDSEMLMTKAQNVMNDYDVQIGPLFTTPNTEGGFEKDPEDSPGLEVERAMIALQQGMFDFMFTPEVYAAFPHLIDGVKFNTCVSFPGDVAPPADPNITNTVSIRANFEDPIGINPSYNINGDGTEHAFRPTGMYVAPGSVVTVTVPNSLVGKDYYVRVGAHEWDLNSKPRFRRLDRITKKFAIESTTVEVFNPMGGAIGILVPYGANDGIVEVSVSNGVEAPFYSLKSFYQTPDFDVELDKPAPWAVFETDNVMYTIPKHSIVSGEYDLMQTMQEWDIALQAINTILARQAIGDKHDVYMIADVIIRAGAFSIGYPMSNHAISYSAIPGPTNFIDGPGPDYDVTFHEYGHAVRISKFPGEAEALVNFLYIMGMNYGLGEDLNEAVKQSIGPNTFDIDNTATHRLVSNSFGTERDIANATTNEVRYQHRGYGHYFEIVELLGWCALEDFWAQEYLDFLNGTDHGINNQDIDSRILRMSMAADADLRPLFHVFGILPQDPVAVQAAFEQNNIPASLIVYNRLQEYVNLIPADNDAFMTYALTVYPNLNENGPTANENFGVGWHYQKSLTYNATEAQERMATLQGIIDLYYSDGAPAADDNPEPCCLSNSLADNSCTCQDGLNFCSLPIELVSFDAQWKEQNVLINWTSQNEEDGLYYEVQRALDGKNFETIDIVNGKSENGMTNQYNFLDKKGYQLANVLYYRLKMVENTLDTRYSHIVALQKKEGIEDLTIDGILPNPFSTFVQIEWTVPNNQTNLQLNIFNGRGQLVQQLINGKVQAGQYQLSWDGKDASGRDLGTGIYYLQLTDGLRRVGQRFLKL